MPPEVFPPVSGILGESVLAEVRPGDRVLDMGTGSGTQAILAASVASDVVAVDINPHAVTWARRNVVRNGLSDRVEALASDVFEAVDGPFDLMVFDPPFRWDAPRDIIETAITDENYQTLTRFLSQTHRYLRAQGRILLAFGTSGDIVFVRELIDRFNFDQETIAEQQLHKDGWTVDYFTYRLTVRAGT